MNTKLSAILVTITTLGVNAFGVHDLTREQAWLVAKDMEIVSSAQKFEKAVRVDMTLTRRGARRSPSSIILSVDYPHSNRPEVRKLKIVSVTKDACGSTQYTAKLSDTNLGVTPDMHPRFNLTLVDHETRHCEDYRPYRWEADVRQGYGWCGTSDATMSVQGNPEPAHVLH